MSTFGDRLFQFGGTPVGGDLLGLHGLGKIRFLDPDNGSDGNSGKKPDQAWATLQYAADSLGYYKANADMNGYHDIIIRLPGVEEVDLPIRFDGDGSATGAGDSISVVSSLSGLRTFGDVLHAHTRMSSAGASAVGAGVSTIYVVRRQINFYGMSFAGRGTGQRGSGDGACIAYRVSSDATLDLGKHASGGGNFHTVRGCNFRDDGSNDTVGIYEYGAGAAEISECTFGYNSAARGPVGIMMRGSATNNCFDIHIHNNLFRQCPVGIVIAAGTTQNVAIIDNVFQTCSIGIQADSGSASSTGIIDGCSFDVADGATAHDNNAGATGDTEANWNADNLILFTEKTYYLGA